MLQSLKLRRKGAAQGFSLLKKKSDALTAKFRGMLKEILEVTLVWLFSDSAWRVAEHHFFFLLLKTKRDMGEELREAAFASAKATYAAGEFKCQIIENTRRPAVTLKLAAENVAGVKLPVFSLSHDSSVDGILVFTILLCNVYTDFSAFFYALSVMGNIGCTSGGQVINAARERYLDALSALIRLASLQVILQNISR